MNFLTIYAMIKKWGLPPLLLVAAFVGFVYFSSHFHCILDTKREGFEWECANERTVDTLKELFSKLQD